MPTTTQQDRIRIIGVDDWLIFGRTSNGDLVYTICEVWPEWLDTPDYGTACRSLPLGADVPEPSACDWRYILRWAARNWHQVCWRESEYGLNMSDDAFRAQTRTRLGYPTD